MGSYKSIIISRVDSLGDVILTLPMAGAIKKQYPNIKIYFLGQNYAKAVIMASENIDEFLSYNELNSLSKESQIIFLKKLNADVIIHVFPNKQIAKLAKKAKISIRIGTNHRPYHILTCNKLVSLGRKNSNLHEAQLNLELLKAIDVNIDYKLKELPALYGYTKIEKLPEKLKAKLSAKRKNIIMHPKSKGSAREWGLCNFQKLIDILPKNKYKIFVTGTQDEALLMTDFLNKNKENITDLTGNLTLVELISFIANADALVAASTGPIHIAAATGIKAVGIFAPMRPIHPGRWMPLGKNATYIVNDENCEICKKGGDCNCIMDISAERVAMKF